MKEFKNGSWVGGVEPEHGESFVQYISGAKVISKHSTADMLPALKSAMVSKIKQEANDRISSLSWKLDRAHNWESLGDSRANVVEVLKEIEGIREASNAAESALSSLTIDEIKLFTW